MLPLVATSETVKIFEIFSSVNLDSGRGTRRTAIEDLLQRSKQSYPRVFRDVKHEFDNLFRLYLHANCCISALLNLVVRRSQQLIVNMDIDIYDMARKHS